MSTNSPMLSDYAQDFEVIKKRVRAAQYDALRTVNRELVALYWDIGGMIAKRQKEQGWGKSVVKALSQDLQKEFPGMSGFSTQNLWYMRQFYLTYPGHSKLQPLVGEISWSKHLIIMARCKDDLQREFYMRMTRKYGWTKNVLAIRIQDQTYEKTMMGQNNFMETLPESISPQAKLAVRDEYTFDFLELGDEHLGGKRVRTTGRGCSGGEKARLLNGWVKASLGDVFELEYGKSLPAKQRDNVGSAVFGSNGIETIKKHTSGVSGLSGKLKYWDYVEVLKVHEALELVNESINSLGLVPQGF